MSEIITPRLFTSCYGAKKLIIDSGLVAVRTSVGHPRWKLAYPIGAVILEIAPLRNMLNLSRDEYHARYINKLEMHSVDTIARRLNEVSAANEGRDLVLLCFEDLTKPRLWCHRTMFAEWWREKTGQAVEELAPKTAPTLF